MKFRNKILLSIYGVVISLLVVTFFIVTAWLRNRIEDTFAEELRGNRSTVAVLNTLQSAQLIRSAQVIAESPRLRAVIELGDSATAAQLTAELSQTTLNDLIMLTDGRGLPLVQMLHGEQARWDISSFPAVRDALAMRPSTDVCVIRDRAYRTVSVPLAVGRTAVGTLTIGFALQDDDLRTLTQVTGSAVLLARDTAVFLGTLPAAESVTLARAALSRTDVADDTSGAILRCTTAAESYVAITVPLNSPRPDVPPVVFIIAKAVGEELESGMRPVLGAFGLLSLLFLAITAVLGNAMARGLARPINELVRGTTEISRGNYDHVIGVTGRSEFGFLAEKFGEMSRTLKEKIRELARLNEDLVGRNRALDDALVRLREAQEEIVRNERLAATGKLTAQLAHEINNPIHNIQSALQTALARLPDGIKGRELIEVAFEEIERMSRLTKQMLDFYRTSLMHDELRPVDVNALLRDVLALAHPQLAAAGVTVAQDFAGDLPRVPGAEDKLTQVFLNIVINARDAMPDGGTLRVETIRMPGAVHIVFRDSGTGISREHLGRVFDAFFTTKSTVSGVGLGLSVSYGIVQQHHGSIAVASEPGEGATFTVSLPAGDHDAAGQRVETPSA
ncbi:MAG: HAMP domain-containing protein [Ignavibacteria bacterium]|nr:HAMP domain-containing protein [Ignavibacteria bacterium]